MTGVDIEVARAALVIGLVLAAVLYNQTRIVSGGAVTGAYLALLAISGHWITILGWFFLSLVGLGAIKLSSRRWPLPRAWLYAIGIVVPASIHVVLIELTRLSAFAGLSSYLVAGLYVTNGLTAYDSQRQGVGKTMIGAGAVAMATYLVLLPVQWGMAQVRDAVEYSQPMLQDPLTVLATIVMALAVRLSLGWGTAGIVGALFFVDMLNWTSFLVVVVFTLLGTGVYRLVEKPLGLTPRQRHYSILAVGAITSWFGLFWAGWLGIPGADVASEFGVEPLLVIGLMIAETVRHGIPKTAGGTLIVVAATLSMSVLAQWRPEFLGVGFAVVVLVAALMVRKGVVEMRTHWLAALAGGGEHQPIPRNS